MRSYIAAAGALAIAATAANAADCNPTYNVTSAGSCINDCNLNAAKAFDSQWTYDSTSEHFVASLALMCDKAKSGSLYTAFMSQAGMCMTACTTAEQTAFFTQYDGACAWYTAHSTDTCAEGSSTPSSTSSSNTTSSTSSGSSGSTASPSGSSAGSSSGSSSGSSDTTTSSSTNNEAAASSTSGAGKAEFGAITAAAVAFAAFIAL